MKFRIYILYMLVLNTVIERLVHNSMQTTFVIFRVVSFTETAYTCICDDMLCAISTFTPHWEISDNTIHQHRKLDRQQIETLSYENICEEPCVAQPKAGLTLRYMCRIPLASQWCHYLFYWHLTLWNIATNVQGPLSLWVMFSTTCRYNIHM